MHPTTDDPWQVRLAARHRAVERIGGGVEGTVYRLGDGLVAKVWRDRTVAQLHPMRVFYDDLRAAGPAVLTPRVASVETIDGSTVTFEEELPGTALQDRLLPDARSVPAVAVDAVSRCLDALRRVPATAAMRALPVLGEDGPFRAAGDTFGSALLGLLDRRVLTGGAALVASVPHFEERYRRLRSRLDAVDPVPDTVLHGDLFGQNVLVDGAGSPTAVLDFGFMTTAGDPRFDAAVTAGVMDMYGAHAAEITAALTADLADRLGYDRDVLVLYRAAYAVLTSTLFGAGPDDGHHRWCAAQLVAPQTSEVLGL